MNILKKFMICKLYSNQCIPYISNKLRLNYKKIGGMSDGESNHDSSPENLEGEKEGLYKK